MMTGARMIPTIKNEKGELFVKANTACMNKQHWSGYSVLTRHYLKNGEYHLEPQWIVDTMSKKCRSDMDIKRVGPCKGCEQEQDVDYFRLQGWI